MFRKLFKHKPKTKPLVLQDKEPVQFSDIVERAKVPAGTTPDQDKTLTNAGFTVTHYDTPKRIVADAESSDSKSRRDDDDTFGTIMAAETLSLIPDSFSAPDTSSTPNTFTGGGGGDFGGGGSDASW